MNNNERNGSGIRKVISFVNLDRLPTLSCTSSRRFFLRA
jgi:hypothetical protein